MSINQIRLYDLFRKELHLPDDKAADFVLAVGEVVGSEAETQKQLLATKEDVHHLERKTGSDIHNLELKIEQFKVDIYKAMFWTGIVQLIAILGGVLAIVKFIR